MTIHSKMNSELNIRPVHSDDDFTAIHSIVSRAYAYWLDRKILFTACHQGQDRTRARLLEGHGFVAEINDQIVGVISLNPPQPDDDCIYYRKIGVWHFNQFAVDPNCQGNGVGTALLSHCEQFAMAHGATEIALDTAQPAIELIEYYQRLGYSIVDTINWSRTNYESYILSKPL